MALLATMETKLGLSFEEIIIRSVCYMLEEAGAAVKLCFCVCSAELPRGRRRLRSVASLYLSGAAQDETVILLHHTRSSSLVFDLV